MAAVIGDSMSKHLLAVPEDGDLEDEAMSDASQEKDAVEEELERLVFGDKAGFKSELEGFRKRKQLGESEVDIEAEEEEENSLATVDSADLFFLDSGPTKSAEGALLPAGTTEDEELALRRDPPAWQDSDDDRMMVSLMSVPRLRKLRQFESEDIISGRDYVRRLRRQFELLHLRPQWADWTGLQGGSKKRRRGSVDSENSEEQASAGSESDSGDEDFSVQPLAKLLRTSEALTRQSERLPNKRIKLQPQTISIERMKDIAPTQPSAITSLSIHPSLPLLLSSGISSTLYLHHLKPHPTTPDPPNPLITSLHLKHTPLTTTAFSPTNSTSSATPDPKIYLSSRRRYFHVWDLPTGQIRKITRIYGHQDTQQSMETLKPSPCGRYVALQGSTRKGGGVVNVLDASTLQWIAQVRIESRKGLADFAWWGDGRGLCVVGKGGEVSEWSAEERRIVERWQDEGAVGTTVIALGGRSPDARKKNAPPPSLGPDRWIAVGSASGIVNIYERGAWAAGAPPSHSPRPAKSLDNLTTPVSHLAFSPCGQLLAVASRWKRDALRLVHLPSCTVYRNWPTSRTPLGRISAVALGEYESGGGDGGRVLVLAVGNEAGALRAWEITG